MQWNIKPEGAVATQYLDGYDSNNQGAVIYDPTSAFTRCTGWLPTPKPNPSPNPQPITPPNTPQINNALSSRRLWGLA